MMANKDAEVSANPGTPGSEQKPAENADQVAVLDPAAQLAAVAAERDHLVEEKAELQDRLLRRTAEFENYRRRVDREKSELRDYAVMEAIRQLLPVLDSFELALAAGCSDAEYARGMALIGQRFASELQKLGLEPIPAEGQTFDPHLHHALEMRETSEAEEHAILAELQKGYNFRGRLLRPALVRVAVAPSSDKKAEK
ncbi:MAG: nucleotide exchange factor GrpE [Bryobacteraceae bacterium]